jgi:hypothetical protein
MASHTLLILVLLALAGAWYWARRIQKQRRRRARYPRYARRDTLLLPREREILPALQHAAGEGLRVLPKVRLSDLVTVQGETESPQRQAHWRSAQRRGVDFLFCTAEDYAPLLAVQLEGRKDRARRRARGDTVLEDVLSSADIRMVVIDPAETLDPAHLGIRVRALLESARAGMDMPGDLPELEAEAREAGQPRTLRRLLGVFTSDLQDLLRRPSETWGLARGGR